MLSFITIIVHAVHVDISSTGELPTEYMEVGGTNENLLSFNQVEVTSDSTPSRCK